MISYELVVIFRPEIDSEEKEKLLQSIKKILSPSGKIESEKEWGKKELAYPIEKQRMGFFYLLTFKAEPAQAANLSKKLNLEEKIIRYLLIRE